MIDVVRQEMIDYINENPHTFVAYERATRVNEFGKTISDISKPAVETTYGTVRVTRRRLPEPFITNAQTPYDFQDVYYLLASYDATWLKRGMIFSYFSQRYRTLYPEQRIIYGEIAYILCNLEQVTHFDAGDIL